MNWEKPGFFAKRMGKVEQQIFAFPESRGTLELRLGDEAKLKLKGSRWEREREVLSRRQKAGVEEENAELEREIEILLDMNARLVLQKNKAQSRLRKIRETIAEYVELGGGASN